MGGPRSPPPGRTLDMAAGGGTQVWDPALRITAEVRLPSSSSSRKGDFWRPKRRYSVLLLRVLLPPWKWLGGCVVRAKMVRWFHYNSNVLEIRVLGSKIVLRRLATIQSSGFSLWKKKSNVLEYYVAVLFYILAVSPWLISMRYVLILGVLYHILILDVFFSLCSRLLPTRFLRACFLNH